MYYAFTGQAVLRCSDNKRAGIAHRQQELSSLFQQTIQSFLQGVRLKDYGQVGLKGCPVV
jgi:hypothetical protein